MITLDPQDVLNKVVAHLKAGGTQSTEAVGRRKQTSMAY